MLSISRLYLHHELGFSTDSVASLTDEEMERMADIVRDNLLFAAGMSFAEEVRFVVACHIVETYGGTDEQQESLRQNSHTGNSL